MSARPGAARRPSGLRDVVVYNWPMYVAATTSVAAAAALAGRLPGPAARLARAGVVAAAWWLAAGTAASWLVYDRSELNGFGWLPALLPDGPGAHLVVSSGLDEASRPIADLWPDAAQVVADLYDPVLMTEGSIRRARRLVPPAPGTLAARPGRLPVADGSRDTVFAVFAAHELRRPADREELFGEIARVLRPGGTLVLVEHLRDPANTAVFGPGAWHFQTRAEWLRVTALAGLRPVSEQRIAGLVGVFAFRGGAR